MTDEDMITKYPHLKAYPPGGVGDVERNKNIRAHLKSLGIDAAVKTDHWSSVRVTLPFGSSQQDLAAASEALECFEESRVYDPMADYPVTEDTPFTKKYGGVKYLTVRVAWRSRDEERAKVSAEKEARKAIQDKIAARCLACDQATKNSHLMSALSDGKIAKVRQWLAAGADPNATDGRVLTTKNVSAVLAVLDAGADVNMCDKSGHTLFHYWAGNKSLCETLVKRGADPRAVSNNGLRPQFDPAHRSKLEAMADAWTAEQARLKLEATVPQATREQDAHQHSLKATQPDSAQLSDIFNTDAPTRAPAKRAMRL
jgi:hypothetical protein